MTDGGPTAAPALDHWIGGAARPSVSGERLDDVCPATGKALARVARGRAEDVEAAVQAARAAQAAWAATPVTRRADLLDAVAERLEARAERLAQLESQDTGKPITTARTIDIPRAIRNFRFFAGAVRHSHDGAHLNERGVNYTVRHPLGVVGLITPWNLPLYLLSWKTAPALAMGNTIVAKPSELTPRTAGAMAEAISEAAAALGLPTGIFNLVHGLGPEAGAAIVGHPDVRGVSFTGGTATGAMVAATAAPRFAKLSLELGGKNATLIFDDVGGSEERLAHAVATAARAAWTNQGQVCLCGSRVLVQRGVHDRFVAALTEALAAHAPGDPGSPETRLGALISHAHRDKVEGYLALARAEGGTVVGGDRVDLGGALSDGAFLAPALVTGLPPTCRTATEEIFGPVVTVHPFGDEAEAIAIANGVRYGLAATVLTHDLTRAHRVAAALEVGMVWVNTWLDRDLRVPFGGVKDSGVGREGGDLSLHFFSEPKNISIALGGVP